MRIAAEQISGSSIRHSANTAQNNSHNADPQSADSARVGRLFAGTE